MTVLMLEMMKVLLIDNLNLKTYLADVSIGCSNPPQGKMLFQLCGHTQVMHLT